MNICVVADSEEMPMHVGVLSTFKSILNVSSGAMVRYVGIFMLMIYYTHNTPMCIMVLSLKNGCLQ